jgi:hypothetical protein
VPDLNYIIEILNNQSKKKYNIISKIYKPYQPLTDINKSLITKPINEKYLNANIYENEKDNIIKSSLGTAKTYSTFDYILKNDYKILSICQLINNIDNWNVPVEISSSGFGIKVNKSGLLDNVVYTANGMVPPSINDYNNGSFVNGGAYRIEGRYGWDQVPYEVELATIELMKDFFSKDKDWRNKYLKSIQTFDWQFEYDTATFSGTGNNYADQLLSEYVLSTMVLI